MDDFVQTTGHYTFFYWIWTQQQWIRNSTILFISFCRDDKRFENSQDSEDKEKAVEKINRVCDLLSDSLMLWLVYGEYFWFGYGKVEIKKLENIFGSGKAKAMSATSTFNSEKQKIK